MFRWLKLSINGRPLWVEVNGETGHLSGLLRSLSVVGPKADCEAGRCAACTVLVGSNPVRSCAVKSEDCVGKDVTTAERLDHGPVVHPMLAAFRKHGVPACTTCMPGMVLAAVAYATRDRELTEDEVRRDLVADACRCEYAANIVAAVLDGASAMHGPARPGQWAR
jgi:aerobic-type carbon monoxide dehydrogenase small subunit (CoxS/CutS family)